MELNGGVILILLVLPPEFVGQIQFSIVLFVGWIHIFLGLIPLVD